MGYIGEKVIFSSNPPLDDPPDPLDPPVRGFKFQISML